MITRPTSWSPTLQLFLTRPGVPAISWQSRCSNDAISTILCNKIFAFTNTSSLQYHRGISQEKHNCFLLKTSENASHKSCFSCRHADGTFVVWCSCVCSKLFEMAWAKKENSLHKIALITSPDCTAQYSQPKPEFLTPTCRSG